MVNNTSPQDIEAECDAYGEHINNLLKNDPECTKYMPLEGSQLFKASMDGVLLSKLVNTIKPGSVPVAKLNKDIDLSELEKKEPGSKAIFKVTENQNMFIAGAEKLGIKIVNVGAQDIIDGKEDLILGLVWQIIRAHLLADINILSHPELIRLLKTGENIQTLLDMGSEQLLLRWFNYHLKRADSKREVLNFSESIKDCENYLVLMKQIAPKLVDPVIVQAALETPNLDVRAVTVLDLAEKLNCRQFVTSKDILAGRQRLNLAFTATLFNAHIGIRLPTEEEIAALFDKVDKLSAEVAQLQTALAEAQRKLKDKSSESDAKIQKLATDLETMENKFEDESSKATALQSNIERLQHSTSQLDKTIVDLRKSNHEQKEAFDRLCNDQSSVNAEVMKQLKATEEQLAQMEVKYQAELEKTNQLTQKLNDLQSSSDSQLKRVQSVSVKSHQSYKDKQKSLLDQIFDLAKSEVAAETLKEYQDKNPSKDDDDLNLNRLKWLVEQLILQKKDLSKKITDQDGQLSRMKQMNDLMADKVKEIAEEMNNKKPSKK